MSLGVFSCPDFGPWTEEIVCIDANPFIELTDMLTGFPTSKRQKSGVMFTQRFTRSPRWRAPKNPVSFFVGGVTLVHRHLTKGLQNGRGYLKNLMVSGCYGLAITYYTIATPKHAGMGIGTVNNATYVHCQNGCAQRVDFIHFITKYIVLTD